MFVHYSHVLVVVQPYHFHSVPHFFPVAELVALLLQAELVMIPGLHFAVIRFGFVLNFVVQDFGCWNYFVVALAAAQIPVVVQNSVPIVTAVDFVVSEVLFLQFPY